MGSLPDIAKAVTRHPSDYGEDTERSVHHLSFSKITGVTGSSSPEKDEIKRNLTESIALIDKIAGYFRISTVLSPTACNGALKDTEQIRNHLQRAHVISERIGDTNLAVLIEYCVSRNRVSRTHLLLLSDTALQNGERLNKKTAGMIEKFTEDISWLKHKLVDVLSNV